MCPKCSKDCLEIYETKKENGSLVRAFYCDWCGHEDYEEIEMFFKNN